MNTISLRGIVAVVGVFGLLTLVRVVAWPLAATDLPASAAGSAPARPAASRTPVAAETVATIVGRDPFRVGRRPAIPAYDPLRLAEQLAPPPPRPSLLLVGVVDGVAPSAVIEGFPGIEGARVVRVGDVIAALRVKDIGRGRVVITGLDTTWTLEVREPWKN